MAERIIQSVCPNCGKLWSHIALAGAAATICPACGVAISLPPPVPPPLPSLAPVTPVAAGTAESAAAMPEPTDELLTEDEAVAAARPPMSASRRLLWALGFIIVFSVWVGLISLAIHKARSSGNAWEDANRDQILAIKAQAGILEAHGNWAESLQQYDRMDKLLSGHRITDPYLLGEMQLAEQSRQRAIDQAMQAALQQRRAEVTRAAALAAARAATMPAASRPAQLANSSSPTTAPAVAGAEPIAASPATAPVARSDHHARAASQPVAHTGVTDDDIGRGIGLGVDYLLTQLSRPNVGDTGRRGEVMAQGEDVIAIYALLQCGLSIHDPRLNIQGPTIKRLLDVLKSMTLEGHPATYTRALRATALALLNRPEDQVVLRGDAEWLIRSVADGAYTYGDRSPTPRRIQVPWDNSNSQYGLLGVWSAAEAGVPVSPDYWDQVRQHWERTELGDGEWYYSPNSMAPRYSMTLAGIASLLVCDDYLNAAQHGLKVGLPPYDAPLAGGLKWLETSDNCLPTDHEPYPGYSLYGLERVGLASGYRFFGTHDWYPELARDTLHGQYLDGSWGNLEESAYRLLFLARGRHPVMMNKLRFDGAWANRPRDVANLARYATVELERPLNWQVTSIERDWRDWTDSPILYLSSHQPVVLSDEQCDKLRSFVFAGGMLLTQADGGSATFDKFATDLGHQLFPEYPWQDVPADHPLYSSFYPMQPAPKITPRMISNGSRILMLHLPQDISHAWQIRADTRENWAFQLGINAFVYAAGKSELRNRLSTPYIDPPTTVPDDVMNVALVRSSGDWDPEPAAWPRFCAWFQQQTGLGIHLAAEEMTSLDPAQTPLARLTGTRAFKATDAQIAGLENYVTAGGTLLIDPCSASGPFLDSAHDLVARAFPQSHLIAVPLDHPMLLAATDAGMEDLATPRLRQFARERFTRDDARPRYFRLGRGAVILLPIDLGSGLLGTQTWGVTGYDPDYSLALAKNFILWAWDKRPEAAEKQ